MSDSDNDWIMLKENDIREFGLIEAFLLAHIRREQARQVKKGTYWIAGQYRVEFKIAEFRAKYYYLGNFTQIGEALDNLINIGEIEKYEWCSGTLVYSIPRPTFVGAGQNTGMERDKSS